MIGRCTPRALEALTHNAIQNQEREINTGMDLDAHGQSVKHVSTLGLWLEHFEIPINISL